MVRRLFGVLATIALASGAMFALVGPASAGQLGPLLTIVVHKDLDGTPSSDQDFSVRVECVFDGEQVYGDTEGISWSTTDGFDPSDANAVFEIPTRVGDDGDDDDIECTVQETGTADATSHTIECIADTFPAECIDPNVVEIPYAETGDADLTITNHYPEPVTTTTTTAPPKPAPTPAPAPVVAAARFTG